jgi:hypothetical protein
MSFTYTYRVTLSTTAICYNSLRCKYIQRTRSLSDALQLTAEDKEQASLPGSGMRIPEELVAAYTGSISRHGC